MATATASSPGAARANSTRVHELTSDATVEALNSALDAHNVAPERILAVHLVPGVYLANGPKEHYRVLYRG